MFAADPERYYKIFEESEQKAEDAVHFPESPEEFQSMLTQMQREGILAGE